MASPMKLVSISKLETILQITIGSAKIGTHQTDCILLPKGIVYNGPGVCNDIAIWPLWNEHRNLCTAIPRIHPTPLETKNEKYVTKSVINFVTLLIVYLNCLNIMCIVN